MTTDRRDGREARSVRELPSRCQARSALAAPGAEARHNVGLKLQPLYRERD